MFTFCSGIFACLRGTSLSKSLIGFAQFLLVGQGVAGGVHLAWNPPAAGPTPIGYNLYYGQKSGAYGNPIDVGNVMAYSMANLTEGATYYFALKSYDTMGNQSFNYSNEVNVTIPTLAAAGLANLSTRGQVGTGNQVLIGGFVIGGTAPKKVVVRALGPTLGEAGVTGALANPTLRLTEGNGTLVASNDNWKTASNASEIQALGRAPKYDAESALLVTLQPNVPYTPIVEGAGGATGIGLVEIYEVE